MDNPEVRKKTADSENKKMFRSRFDIFVLNALNSHGNGEGYGYDVINYIQTKTKGHYKIKTFSTIYNTLKRLEEQGFVTSHKGGNESNGAARVYYVLTEEGKEYLNDNKLEYKYLRTLLDNLLTNEDFDLDAEPIPYSASELKPLTKRVRTNIENYSSDNEQLSDKLYNDESSDDVYLNIEEFTNDSNQIDDGITLLNEDDYKDKLIAASTVYSDSILPKENDSSSRLTSNENLPIVDASNNNGMTTAIKSPIFNESVKTVNKKTKSSTNNNDYKFVFDKITAPVLAGLYKENENNTSNTQKKQSVAKPKKAPNQSKNASIAKLKTDVSANMQARTFEMKESQNVTAKENSVQNSDTLNNISNIEKFKGSLRSEGYVLNTVKPNNSNVTRIKYVFVNKLMRDSVMLSALYAIITLLVLYLCKDIFAMSLTAMITCIAVFVSIALFFVFVWARNPDKRKKDTINLKAINAICIAFFTIFFMIDLIVCLLIPNGKSLNSPQIYTPVIVASTSIVFGLIFSILYKSDNYFQK